jgi:hypothetical protein
LLPGHLIFDLLNNFIGKVGPTGGSMSSAGVIAVNQAFVKRFFAGGDVLGKRLQLFGDPKATREIVGVVGNISPGALTKSPQTGFSVIQLLPGEDEPGEL